MIPGNPYAGRAEDVPDAGDAIALAVLALAHEQHQRNRIAAVTALHRGLTLPPDLEDLTTGETR